MLEAESISHTGVQLLDAAEVGLMTESQPAIPVLFHLDISTRQAEGFYLMHHLLEYRRDNQRLRMSPTTNDAEIVSWATSIGSTPDHRIRAEFYHVQCELAQVIMKQVLEPTGMFYHGPITREDVRALVLA